MDGEQIQTARQKKAGMRNLRNGILWSTKTIAYGITNTLFVSYFSFYATDVLGMSATLIATVLLITKLFDGVTDLIAGFIVDNTHTRWGKARPYDWTIPFIALFTILSFSAPKASSMVQAIYLGAMYVLTQAVFYTLLGASDNVYLLRAFPHEEERNSVFGISTVFGQIIGIAQTVLIPVLVEHAGTSQSSWTKMVIILAVPFAAIGMLRFFTIKEISADEPIQQSGSVKKKSGVSLKDGAKAIISNRYILILTGAIFLIVICSGLLNTAGAYYVKYFIGDQSALSVVNLGSYAAIVMLVLFVPLSNKIGKGKVMKLGLITSLFGAAIRLMGGTNILTLTIGMGLVLFGVMPISVYFPLYLFDIMDYGEWKTGKRVEGVLAVFPAFAVKVASGLSVSLATFILGAAGYDGNLAVQSEQAMRAINLCYNIIPATILAVMVLLMCVLYNIDKVMPTVQADLKARREAASVESRED